MDFNEKQFKWVELVGKVVRNGEKWWKKWCKMVKKLGFGLKNLVIKKIPRRLLFIDSVTVHRLGRVL